MRQFSKLVIFTSLMLSTSLVMGMDEEEVTDSGRSTTLVSVQDSSTSTKDQGFSEEQIKELIECAVPIMHDLQALTATFTPEELTFCKM